MNISPQWLGRKLSTILGAEVQFKELKVALLAGSIEVIDLKVGDFLTAARGVAKVSLGRALKKEIVVRSLTIERPIVDLQHLPKRQPRKPRDVSGDEPARWSFDLERVLPGVAERDEVVGVPDQHRGVRPRPAFGVVADSGGLLHPVQGDVQQQRAGHTALRNAVLGAMQPALLNHARLQPLRDHSPGGERAEHGQDVVVRHAVERRCQIRV
jgi:hypothetical protein